MKTTMHSLRRTSPYGASFIGKCVLCGKEGLTFKDMSKRCSNKTKKTQEEVLVDALTGGEEV